MPYRNTSLTILSVLITFTGGCAGWSSTPGQITRAGSCGIEHTLVHRNASEGVEFTNHCKQCLAVAFEFETAVPGDRLRNACYVPAETRVFFATGGHYTVKAEKICQDVEADESIASVPVEDLKANYINDKCKIIGVFAD